MADKIDYSKPSGNLPNAPGFFAKVCAGLADDVNLTIGDIGNRVSIGKLHNEELNTTFDGYLSNISNKPGYYNVDFFGSYDLSDNLIGDHSYTVKGKAVVSIQGQITFDGYLSSFKGVEPYNFNPGNRPFLKESLTTFGRVLTSTLGVDLPVFNIIGQMPVSYETTHPNMPADPRRCFPAGTLITLTDGSKKTIELITTADRVLTFDDEGNACAGVVERTYRNTTTEFIRLVFDDGRDDLVATPGHAFLTEAGDYLEIAKMARLGGGVVRLVDCSGQIATAKAEHIAYAAETAHFFATSSIRAMAVSGNLMLKEDRPEGWATYNFEVRTTHNYVAGDIRVHNQSGMIGQLGDTLDTGLDRLSGVRDGDGSFLDKASDLVNAGMHVVGRAMKNVSAGFFNIGNSIAIALLCALTVTGCYAITHEIFNWQDEPKACSEFWDRNFSKAINGNSDAASALFLAIMNRNLTPPGRQVNSYRGSKEMDFDTLALKRLSIHAGREPGDAPVSRWSDSIWYGYSEENDPRGVHRKTDEILNDYFCIISVSESPRVLPGICSQRNGLENTTDEWAISCRKILANDDILPSTEEFLASIPEGKHACNYMDGSNAK